MANSLTTNPIIIDTTVDAAVTGVRKIQLIIWASNSDHEIAADAELKITDTAGGVKVQIEQPTAKENMAIPYPRGLPMDGIKVPTLDSGEVFIYLEPRN